MRLIRAAAELRLSGESITTIALCTEAERSALFVREADDHQVIASDNGIAYLDYAELERAMIASRADAAWVGWGFVAEHAQFADLCDRLGITFIGPSGDSMRLLGDKIGAKRLAESVGAPVAAWSGGPVRSAEEAERHATEIGFPLLVKAAAGGGGRGIRFVDRPSDVADAYERASLEAARSFGDPTVFMERRLTGAHHIEVQIAADHHGGLWALGVRDCSVQRRNQKVIEESASPVLDPAQVQEIAAAAVDLARAADYRNLGTVEFLYQPAERQFAFLEVNTRLQVEHGVTEATTGVDLVKLQLRLAAGDRLIGLPPEPYGHAIEARLNAEDPQQGFSPAPGLIEHLDFAPGPGIRLDTGMAVGDVIPPDYDAMVAKIIAWGRDRDEARVRLLRSLRQTSIVVRGGTTNKAFLTDILGRREFVDGSVDTGWLDRLTESGAHVDPTHLDLALIVAAIDAWELERSLERASFYRWAARGRPQCSDDGDRTIDFRVLSQRYQVSVVQVSPDHYSIELDGDRVDVGHERLRAPASRLRVGDRSHRVTSVIDGADHLIEIDGHAHRVSRDSAGLVRAPAPAFVVSVAVQPGDTVVKGQPLVVLESMKMETTLAAPIGGTVRDVHAVANTQIDAGAPLLLLDPDDSAPSPESLGAEDGRIRFAPAEATGADRATPRSDCVRIVAALRWLLLGFDAGHESQLLDRYGELRGQLGFDEEILQAELELLQAFADVCALARNRPDDGSPVDELRSPELYFHRYLRSLDAEAEGLPESFRVKLRRALGHLGVSDLDQTAALQVAAHQLFLAQRQTGARRPVVMAVLSQLPAPTRSMGSELVGSELGDAVRSTLDRLVDATQVRHPSVGDLARSVRFRIFDEPSIERSRQRVLGSMRDHLAAIDRGDRQGRIEELARCPYPLVGLLADHEPSTSFDMYAPLLEVLTTRNYQIRDIEGIEQRGTTAAPVLVTRYRRPDDGERLHSVATLADVSALPAALGTVGAVAADVETAGRIVIDVYVSLDDTTVDAATLAPRAAEALATVDLPAAADRVAFSAAGPDGVPAAVTFRRTDGSRSSWWEDEAMRGIHPMIAVRLGLWRLRPNFELEPKTGLSETHLFRAVAKDDPGDERFFAAAEVRDLAPVRNEDGRLTALPGLEQAYAACIDGLRRAQIERDGERRLLWNRIFIYVWQPVDFDVAEAAFVVNELEPLGQGLGIEEVGIQAKLRQADGSFSESLVRIEAQAAKKPVLEVVDVPTVPLRAVNDYERKVVICRQRGTVYPYELTSAMAGPGGSFVEYDIDRDGELVAVDRAPGLNSASVVAGMATTPSVRYPEGMKRMVLMGDPTKSLGSLTEAECRVVIGALDRAEQEDIPVEWISLSSGARIAMDSGTENMDWIAATLRRIVDFTQGGGEINIIVAGINVGAQPYWNAEATMLQHTTGILVMTPQSAMVLTGKQALDISGGVSAEDNFGIGGYDRIMGPNGQAQYWAPDLTGACEVLFNHYEHTYRAPGETFPRRRDTEDPYDRDVRACAHPPNGGDFTTVGDIFSDVTNPGRKKPFDIRTLMRAVLDQDTELMERWAAMEGAESAVVYDATLGGLAVTMIGVESRPLRRFGTLPADGPDQWTAGTLFPKSSKKVARAINAASGNRPLVILANLSGFDGSPESLRELQLEYGAEIGRAIVNFDGPIVFCVVSRYHGGAFVVFSGTLHDNMTVLAVEGTYASVLGGAPAAAVVFSAEVAKRVARDQRILALEAALADASSEQRSELGRELAATMEVVRSEKLGEIAAEFDAVHSIERAQQVGSVDRIITASALRPELIAAVERGMDRHVETSSATTG